MTPLRIVALVCTLLLIVCPFAGCDARAQDKIAIQAVMDQIDHCNNTCDGPGAVALMAERSFGPYERLIKIALDGTAAEVRALPPGELQEVLTIRLLGKRSEIKDLKGKQYQEYATSKGFYAAPEEYFGESSFRRWKFGSDWAEAEVVEDGKPTGVRLRFYFEDGRWTRDESMMIGAFDAFTHDLARRAGMSTEKFEIMLLEDRLGRKIPDSVWNPMR